MYRQLNRRLKKSIVGCFEGAQLQLRRCNSFVVVITRRPSGRRGICFSIFSAASQAERVEGSASVLQVALNTLRTGLLQVPDYARSQSLPLDGYCSRKAAMGSMVAARLAGSRLARTPTTASVIVPIASVSGS